MMKKLILYNKVCLCEAEEKRQWDRWSKWRITMTNDSTQNSTVAVCTIQKKKPQNKLKEKSM